jgi:16S rRNA (cytidine1402-2'-O)-methyltransferase
MLTVVPTPIGNLEDMTPRGLRALKEASAVFCEDTRRTQQLMSHFGISKPLVRYEEKFADRLVERADHENIALVSDGGTPAISDPGRRAVALARKKGIPVTSLPGANAVTTALAGSGLPADSFIFLGFLPRAANKQRKALQAAAALEKTIVVYESPFRVVALLELAQEALGEKAQCCLVRELSKVHEEWHRGTIPEVRASLKTLLGEFVVMLHPSEDPESDSDEA